MVLADRAHDGIQISLQARPGDDVRHLAAEAERLGYARFLVADHPGTTPDPFVLLAAAAQVTTTIGLGTYVLNGGLRDPWQVASAIASVDELAGGRARLGLGAGHTPAEWRLAGREPPPAGDRVARLEELVEVVEALLTGEPVTFHGAHFALDGATLAAPRPVRPRVPLIVGGNGTRVLRLAGRRADVVSLSGLGRTLPDGHQHETRWRRAQVDDRLWVIEDAAAGREPPPLVEVLVQHVELTHDRETAARRLLEEGVPGLDVATALDTPFLLLGTVAEITGQLRAWRARLGIAAWVVRPPALAAMSGVMKTLDR